jgi:beta-mannan synthase
MEEGLGLWGRALATAGPSWDRVAAAWAAAVRARAVAPALEAAVWLCLATSVMLVLEVCYMSIVSFVAVKLLRRVPERRYRWEPMPVLPGSGKDEEAAAGGGEAYYPMVLVQIPMYNEREVRRFQLVFSPVAADSHYYHNPFLQLGHRDHWLA